MPFKANAAPRHRTPRACCRVTNWSAYEAGPRQRGDLMLWLDQDAIAGWAVPRRSTPGGQARCFDLAVELVPTLRLVFHLALRQAEGVARCVLALLGPELRVPDHTTLSRRGRSLAAQAEGIGQGCDQVVFLDAVERRWVEELGGMNIFFVFEDGSLRTPPLTGTILPGITRDSLIMLARDMGFTVHEEPYAIDQWQADAESGRLREAFACGTAAVVTSIGRVRSRERDFQICDGGPGSVTDRLKVALTNLQFGRTPDHHMWLDRLF